MTHTPFPTAFFRWEEEERAAMARVIASDRFTMGPEVSAFEEEVSAYHGRKYGLMVNSGSSANLLAVAALTYLPNPLQRGDLAVVPALAWSTTYAPLIQHGLQLQLADIDDTWNAPPALSVVMVPRRPVPRLIVVASILGNPAYLEGWEKLARDAGAYLIEDNCESIGARTVDGKLAGTAGIASTLSFFWSHQLGAIEGGMILTDNEEVISICRMLRDHGLTRTLPDAIASDYDFELFGYNLRPLEIHAAVGRAQLAKLPAFMAARTENQHYFIQCAWAAGLPLRFQAPRGTVSPFGVAFEVPPEQRSELTANLKEVSIDSRPPTGGSFLRHAYGAPWRDQRTPRADAVHNAGMFIGNPPYRVTEPYDRAVEAMKKVLL